LRHRRDKSRHQLTFGGIRVVVDPIAEYEDAVDGGSDQRPS
jgi:hypothetical protein